MNRGDRDLAIIGVGAFLTVLCLLFNWPFAVRVVVGLLILVAFMIIALTRLGPDREPIEVHFLRLWNNLRSPHKFTFQGGDHPREPKGVTSVQTEPFSPPVQEPVMGMAPANVAMPFRVQQKGSTMSDLMPAIKPITFSWKEVDIYRLVTILLAMVGIYFIYWLARGGSEEIGLWMKSMILKFAH